jgi:hypothetical protein
MVAVRRWLGQQHAECLASSAGMWHQIQLRLHLGDARELNVERSAEGRHLQGLFVKTEHELLQGRRCRFRHGALGDALRARPGMGGHSQSPIRIRLSTSDNLYRFEHTREPDIRVVL